MTPSSIRDIMAFLGVVLFSSATVSPAECAVQERPFRLARCTGMERDFSFSDDKGAVA